MKKAFTLIELLVVIAIIAILAAMLMPALNRARAEARKGACKGHLHDIGMGLTYYRNDYNYQMPVLAGTNSRNLGVLMDYIDNVKVFNCPSGGGDARVTETDMPGISPNADDDFVIVRVMDSDYGIDNNAAGADMARVVMADIQVDDQHGDGANAMYSDTHITFIVRDRNGNCTNPLLYAVDTDIYSVNYYNDIEADGACPSNQDCSLDSDPTTYYNTM